MHSHLTVGTSSAQLIASGAKPRVRIRVVASCNIILEDSRAITYSQHCVDVMLEHALQSLVESNMLAHAVPRLVASSDKRDRGTDGIIT